jgi:pimeloyl-ACP methyl ester carboxylesterase
MIPPFSLANAPHRLTEDAATVTSQVQRVISCYAHHIERMSREHGGRAKELWNDTLALNRRLGDVTNQGRLLADGQDYGIDAGQRFVLFLDILRERGNNDIAHEAAGTPPVLVYETEGVLDGRNFPRPVNYMLLKILPPEGVQVFDNKRPYMIIDPRAGHGAGIGGFKLDSQVGVALHRGHPVYFVVFRPHPEPNQTLADVMRAEADFVREIARRHPDAPQPIIVGNCQGGWATLILAAANPDITGPLVINGAPVSYWSGRIGENPMRYNGGLLGGVVPALLLSDLGYGEFDGAHLVGNFEMLNPGRNYFGKYYDLFADPDRGRNRFLEFERWWGGFHFMNEAEIRWIVEQLFVGNRLARGEARIERGRQLDLKAIRSPIIVFASYGDNITPPQQALNWIVDTYADEHEIRIRGQRIIYMVHRSVGHLGIFVSSSIAKKEHTEVASTMRTIEALAPGLYEMKIEEQIGEGVDAHFLLSFHERKMADILAIDENDRSEERGFAAVARLSEIGSELYEMGMRPVIQAMVTPELAAAVRDSNPTRVQRLMFSDRNPMMRPLQEVAARVADERKPADADNPFLAMERLWAASVSQGFDFMRDARDALYELTFLSIYGAPFMQWIARSHAFERTRKDPKELRFLPETQAVLLGISRGGFEEAVIRMLILLAESRGSVRRDRLERSAKVLSNDEPFASLGAERRAGLIREQSIIAEFEPDRAVATLPGLLAGDEQRRKAVDIVEFIAGAVEEMEPHTLRMVQRFRAVLGLPPIALPAAASDPLSVPPPPADGVSGGGKAAA